MRIFIDCTDTYNNGLNTGIQRVVRNLGNHCIKISAQLGFWCHPVILLNDRYISITTVDQNRIKQKHFSFRNAANKFYTLFARKIASFLPLAWRRFITGSKHEISLARLIVLLLSPLIGVLQMSGRTFPINQITPNTIQFKEGDILLLADCVWNYSPWAAVQAAKSSGAQVAAIVYDVIPVTHGKFFAPSSQGKFIASLPLLFQYASAFFCISDYTKTQLQAYYSTQPCAYSVEPKNYYTFSLGVEPDKLAPAGIVRTKISTIFRATQPIYLAVGTLEPRKNHAYLLQAFQKLWDAGKNSTLLIVGRVGWMCDELLETIWCHPKFGQQLFFMDDVSDAELDYCYAHAYALLFSSVVEGFGLPIIEALRKGLPVFASDIPVFHEVGGEYVVYFDLADPTSLVGLLTAYEASGKYLARSSADFNWPDWSQSTTALLSQLAEMHSPQPIA